MVRASTANMRKTNPDASTKPTRNPNMKKKTNPDASTKPSRNPNKNKKTNPDASTKPSRNPNTKTETNPDAMASSKTIRLKSSDGRIFKVEELVALESLTIKKMIEDGCGNNVILLPKVEGKILSMIINYCRKHVYTDKADSFSDLALAMYDTAFISVDDSTYLEISLAAIYLNIKSLIDLSCDTFLSIIFGKTPEEIRKTFNLKNDFSQQDLDLLRVALVSGRYSPE